MPRPPAVCRSADAARFARERLTDRNFEGLKRPTRCCLGLCGRKKSVRDQPTKKQLPGELRRALDAMSDEALQVASRKFIESGLGPNHGGISFDETLVNLTHARDVLSAALNTGMFIQSSLRIQHELYGQVRALDGQLADLAAGKDVVSALQAGVEKLNEEVWQYRLLDLSSEGALGFQARMNQLKSQEALIRKAVSAAGEFDGLYQNADRMIGSIAERVTSIAAERASTAELVKQLQTILSESTEINQQMTTLGTQAGRQESIATGQLIAARQAFTETEAVAMKSREAQAELVKQLQTILSESTEISHKMTTLGAQAARQESIATGQLIAARQAFAETEAVATKSREAQAEIDAGRNAFKKLAAQAQQLVATTESAAKAALTKQLQEFTTKSDAAVAGFVTKSETSLTAGDDELKRLVAQFDELEGQAEKAMERATGASLLQAFQRRQLDMLGAKKFWGTALALSVVVLLAFVGYFVYTLPFVTAYDAAFYTRVSVAIPLTWAVGFCGFRYSRERRRAREFDESLPPILQASGPR